MTKIFMIALLSLLAFFGMAQTGSEFMAMLDEIHSNEINMTEENTQDDVLDWETNLLNTVEVSLDKAHNRINFKTPHIIEGVNITIKQRGERVILQQNNMTISKEYSITFPDQAGINQYTVILQKDNHLLVERVEKDWM